MDYNTTSSFDSFESQLSPESQSLLKQAAGWALFLSIIGFIVLAFSLLGSLGMMAAGGMMDSGAAGANPMTQLMSGGTLGIIMLVFTILWALPVFSMFKFATKMRNAINNNNTVEMLKGFQGLRSYFMFMGILTIISIIVYIIWIAYFITKANAMM